jgi:hypothetical protein
MAAYRSETSESWFAACLARRRLLIHPVDMAERLILASQHADSALCSREDP